METSSRLGDASLPAEGYAARPVAMLRSLSVGTAMAVGLASAICSTSIAHEKTGRWRTEIQTDKLTDKRNKLVKNRALQTFSQFGRSVESSLVLHCMQAGSEKPYPRAIMIFSERVGVARLRGRHRIDTGRVFGPGEFRLDASGRVWLMPFEFDAIAQSSKVRVEIQLPWAGDVFLEFDTRQAEAVSKQLECIGR